MGIYPDTSGRIYGISFTRSEQTLYHIEQETILSDTQIQEATQMLATLPPDTTVRLYVEFSSTYGPEIAKGWFAVSRAEFNSTGDKAITQ
jgi:hypothetical protein